MVIEALELVNFRNYDVRKLTFSHKNVFFTGPNGSGKTNLLESIAFLSLLRSFRTASVRELVRLGAREFQLKAVVNKGSFREQLKIVEQLSGKRLLEIDHRQIHRSSEFIREFHTVVFSPEDRHIADGSSGNRRKFFDILLSTVAPEYLHRLSRYHRALMQRNRALKQNAAIASAFDSELADNAPYIAAKRREYAALIAAAVSELLQGKAEFAVNYRSDTPETAQEYQKLLESRREYDAKRCCTMTGIQLDEFEFLFNGKLLRSFGSTGQIRLISLLLKLAHFKLVRTSAAIPVAVLADDVTGELDEANLSLFLQNISAADQLFFTFAEPPRFQLPDSQEIKL